MGTENRKQGNAFERELCKDLSLWGFWVHNLAQNKQGQPFDVLAARNGKTYPIDCKVCTHNTFNLSRIEENQKLAMSLWEQTGNGEGWFALKMSNSAVYLISFSTLKSLSKPALSAAEIRDLGIPLGKWVFQCE